MRVKITRNQLKELVRQSMYEAQTVKFKDPETDKEHEITMDTAQRYKADIDAGDKSKEKIAAVKAAGLDKDDKGAEEKPEPKTTKISTDPFSDKDDDEFDVGGPSYPNVPKGAKSSEDVKRIKNNRSVEDIIKKKELESTDLPFWSVQIKGKDEPYHTRAASEKEAKRDVHAMAYPTKIEIGDVKVDDDRWEKIHGGGDTSKPPQPSDFGGDMEKYLDALNQHMKDVEKKIENESVNESKMKRFTVKEVRMWMKKLEENRYKKVYNSDARRVAWMVNNEGRTLDEMPMSMKKKWSKAQYGRERYLATEFLKSKSEQMNEGKLTEDFKNNEWEVYVADENRREKIVKVAKSKRAAVILYNKLIKTDKYHEVGMRVIKEGKLTKQNLRKIIRESIKKIIEGKIVRYEIPMKDKKKVEKIVKKLKLKDTKDYAIYGSGKTFEMELDSKHSDKVLELLMKLNIKVRG
jgi:hypothetical protein